MTKKAANPDLETVGLKLDLLIEKGFKCRVCGNHRFAYNAMGFTFCRECGVTYHVDTLKNIYK